MSYEERQGLIRSLEDVRASRVISYITSDRPTFPEGVPGFGVPLDSGPQVHLLRLLRQIGHAPRLDLFLYTRGGATDSVWPVVSALREHSDQFAVLVPFRAHSGGTLIALAATELVLGQDSELSPIDPTTGNPFNPADPTNPTRRYGISVEDVAAYFNLAKEQAEIVDPAGQVEVFRQLTEKVHPLALGSVRRVYMQIRRLATKLLGLHLTESGSSAAITEIVRGLTEEFYSHVHAISRPEAIELLGDWARTPSEQEQQAMTALFEAYVRDLHLDAVYSLPAEMADNPLIDVHAVGAFLETTEASYVHETDTKVLQRPALPPNVQVQVPPGGIMPVTPWPQRQYDFGVVRTGWHRNEAGV